MSSLTSPSTSVCHAICLTGLCILAIPSLVMSAYAVARVNSATALAPAMEPMEPAPAPTPRHATFSAEEPTCQQVADKLNLKLDDISDGVYIHIFEDEDYDLNFVKTCPASYGPESPNPWCPSFGDINRSAVSFSLLYNDIFCSKPGGTWLFPFGESFGFVLDASGEFDPKCFYGQDSSTHKRTHCACGNIDPSMSPPSKNSTGDQPPCYYVDGSLSTCSDVSSYEKNFVPANWDSDTCSLSKTQFETFSKVHYSRKGECWNEVIIRPWINSAEIPILAFVKTNLYQPSPQVEDLMPYPTRGLPLQLSDVDIYEIAKLYNELYKKNVPVLKVGYEIGSKFSCDDSSL